VHLQRRGDGTFDVVPAHIDNTGTGVRQSGEGVWEEVEVVRTAAGALVDDHGRDLFAVRARNGDAAATVGAVGPVAVAQGSAVEASGEGVGLLEQRGSVSRYPCGFRCAVVYVGGDVYGRRLLLTEKLQVPPCTLPP